MSKIDDILKNLNLPPPEPPAFMFEKPKRHHKELPKGVCGKAIFPSQHAADNAGRSLLKKGKGTVSKLRSYLCTECKGWHLSSSIRP